MKNQASHRVFKSDAFESIRQSSRALHKVGAITKTTLREFDEACLAVPELLKPKDIAEHHERG